MEYKDLQGNLKSAGVISRFVFCYLYKEYKGLCRQYINQFLNRP